MLKKLTFWLNYENNERYWGDINWPLCADIAEEIH